jgi:hypothetical protein
MPRQKTSTEEKLAKKQERTRRWRAKKDRESQGVETTPSGSNQPGDGQTSQGQIWKYQYLYQALKLSN